MRNTANNQRENNITLLNEAKAGGCKKCGEKRTYVLDFHHRNPQEKIGEIAKMSKSSGIATFAEELKKCDVLCANCHREFHFLNKEYGITYDDYINNKNN